MRTVHSCAVDHRFTHRYSPSLTIFLALLFSTLPAFAERLVSPHLDVALISDHTSVAQNQPFKFGVWFKPEPEWHVYWKYAGDSGSAAHMDWKLADGIKAEDVAWPTPERIQVGPLVNFGYSSDVLLSRTATFSGSAPTAQIKVDLEWLVCRDECIPGNAMLSLDLPVAETAAANDDWQEAFNKAANSLPQSASSELFTAEVSDSHITLRGAGALDKTSSVFFFPSAGYIQNSAPQKLTVNDESYVLTLERNPNYLKALPAIEGIIHSSKGFSQANMAESLSVSIPVTVPSTATEQFSELPVTSADSSMNVWTAIIFGLLGGMLLNLMPCVLPVLSLKILSLVSCDAKKRSLGALWYTIGLMSTMMVFASVLVGSKQLGWGFQLQSPHFIAGLAVIMLVVALNLFGVFEFSGTSRNFFNRVIPQEGMLSEFFGGVLVTVLATPCSAPFMASAIGYALSTSTMEAYSIFFALALGLALPMLLVAIIPGAARIIPRPGQWMVTLKQILAFPLLGTVIWLVWIFGLQSGFSSSTQLLWILLAAGFASWLFDFPSNLSKTLAAAVLLSCFYLVMTVQIEPRSSALTVDSAHYGQLQTEPYSPERLASLRASGTPVFVDFTAAWCITCQVNKNLVFGSAQTVSELKKKSVVVLEADWTNQDKSIGDELAKFGRKGVPLNLAYPAGKKEPVVLPQLLTSDIVLAAF